jgi:hypothetical protein
MPKRRYYSASREVQDVDTLRILPRQFKWEGPVDPPLQSELFNVSDLQEPRSQAIPSPSHNLVISGMSRPKAGPRRG